MQRQGPATLEGATNRPNHCSKPSLYSMDSAYPLSINKMRNGGERKEREKEVFIELKRLSRTNKDPEEWV